MYFGEPRPTALDGADAGGALGVARSLRRSSWSSASSTSSGSRAWPPRGRRRFLSAERMDASWPGRRGARGPRRSSTAPTPRRCAAPPPADASRSGSSRGADRGARPAGPGLGVARGQFLRQPLLLPPPIRPRPRSAPSSRRSPWPTRWIGRPGRGRRFALKWPNDVLLDGRQGGRHPAREVRGGRARRSPCDRHRRQPPRGARRPMRWSRGRRRPVSVDGETGVTLSPEEFLDLLAPAFARWDAQLDRRGLRADPQRLARPRRAARRDDHRPLPWPRPSRARSRRSTRPARSCSRPPRAAARCRRPTSISRRRDPMLLALTSATPTPSSRCTTGSDGRGMALLHRPPAHGRRVFRLASPADGASRASHRDPLGRDLLGGAAGGLQPARPVATAISTAARRWSASRT